jgi:hypothetical protein
MFAYTENTAYEELLKNNTNYIKHVIGKTGKKNKYQK